MLANSQQKNSESFLHVSKVHAIGVLVGPLLTFKDSKGLSAVIS